jgi:hypothetical protein
LSQLKSWSTDLDRIREEVIELAWSATIYERVRAMVAANPAINIQHHFHNWLSRNYVDAQLIGIRRQLDRDPRSISLFNLVTSMAGHSRQLTRTAHVSLYRDGMERLGHRTFDRLAGPGKTTYPLARLNAAIRALEKIRATHGRYVNKRLAHSDRSALTGPLPTYRDLNNAVMKLQKLVIHYHLLFTAQGYRSLVPVSDYDWQNIFRQPWLPPTPPVRPRRGA